MREIKFCALSVSGEWLYFTLGDLVCGNAVKGGDLYLPDTWRQYTGLKDRNGVEIYEGDIVKSLHNGKHYPIKFGRCYLFDGEGDDLGVFYGLVWDDSPFSCDAYDSTDKYEVIGNIYENPELLKAP